jgi:hypothetical protein
MILRWALPLVAVALLAACADYNPEWAPVVDVANDQHADRLKSDKDQCRQLALHAGEQGVTLLSRSTFFSEDGTLVSRPLYERAYINCLKQRKHPVIN